MADKEEVSVPVKAEKVVEEQVQDAKSIESRFAELLKHLALHGIHFKG